MLQILPFVQQAKKIVAGFGYVILSNVWVF